MAKLKNPDKKDNDKTPKGTPPKLTKDEYNKLSNQKKEAYITAYGQGNFLKPSSNAAQQREERNSGGGNNGPQKLTEEDYRKLGRASRKRYDQKFGDRKNPYLSPATPQSTPNEGSDDGSTPDEPDPPSDPGGMDWDTAYATGLAGAEAQRTAGLGSIYAQRRALQADYGFAVGDDGLPIAGTPEGQFWDSANPYSRAALLQKLYNRRKAGTTNSLASRGQLYSGAIQNARNFDASNFNQDYDRLSRDYSGRMNQYGADEAGVNAQYEYDASQLFAQRLRDAFRR